MVLVEFWSKFVIGFTIQCVVLHHIVSDKFVLNQRGIFERTLFCRMPWVWVLVVAKKTLVLFLSGSPWWWFVVSLMRLINWLPLMMSIFMIHNFECYWIW